MKLSPRERGWLEAILDAVLPRAELPGDTIDASLSSFIDDLLESAPRQFSLGLRLAIWVVTWSPLFVIGRFATFSSLDERSRDLVLQRLGTSSIYLLRELPMLFKTVGCLAWCGLPSVQSAIGVAPVDQTLPDWARK